MIDALLGGPAPQRSFPAAPSGSVCSLPFSCFALLPSRSRHRRTSVPRPYRPWPRGRPSPSIRRRWVRSPDGYAVGTNNDFDAALRKVRPDSAERVDGARVRCSVIVTSEKIMSASIERFAKPLRHLDVPPRRARKCWSRQKWRGFAAPVCLHAAALNRAARCPVLQIDPY